MAAVITRRSVLAALGVGLGAALAGCDGDPGAQDPPPAPGPNQPDETSPPPSAAAPPDTDALLLALTRSRELAAACASITGASRGRRRLQEQVQDTLDGQVAILENVLTAGGVALPDPAPTDGAGQTSAPPATGDGAASTTSGDSAGSTNGGDGAEHTNAGDEASSTQGPDEEELAAAALRDLARDLHQDVSPEALLSLTQLSAANLPMLLSLTSSRGACAQVLGEVPPWGDLTGPTGAAANELLTAYRPAVYGFEVLAARSREEERTAYEEVLTPLREVTRQITALAAEAAAPAPLGYGLPPLTGKAADREELAMDLLAALPPAIMGQTAAFTGDQPSIAGSVRLLAEASALAQPWISLRAFPGMRAPSA